MHAVRPRRLDRRRDDAFLIAFVNPSSSQCGLTPMCKCCLFRVVYYYNSFDFLLAITTQCKNTHIALIRSLLCLTV